MGKPMRLPALDGAAAEPLRFMDFLLHTPVRSVMLHGSGVAVTVPSPDRFAVHKLIISQRRLNDVAGQAKARKDLAQATELIEAMRLAGSESEIEAALAEATARGPKWAEAIHAAMNRAQAQPAVR
jgi:hypothetical protein